MKTYRHPMLDWGRTFSSMAEYGVPERQFLITAHCWVTDSVCSYSGMWNESGFQLLYLFFLFSVWIHLLSTIFSKLYFWIALSLLCESWACSARGGAWLQENNTNPCSTWSTLQWGATCWNSRDHAIFHICTAKKVERWAVWDISKARGCWNIDGSTHSFTSMLLKYKISIKSDRLEAKANNFVS